jgi:hypothetical protein
MVAGHSTATQRFAMLCSATASSHDFVSSIRAELRPKLLNEPIVLYSVLVRALGATDETAKTSSDPESQEDKLWAAQNLRRPVLTPDA